MVTLKKIAKLQEKLETNEEFNKLVDIKEAP